MNSLTQSKNVSVGGSNSYNGYRLPLEATLNQAARLAIVEDKSIYMDYWTDSLDKKALIGVKNQDEKMLVKNESEYTSNITKLYKVNGENNVGDFIVITENSIYLVDSKIPPKKISM
jgi:hypothetical protein